MLLPQEIRCTGTTLQWKRLPEVPVVQQDSGKCQQVGWIQLKSVPTSLINPQPHVRNLLRLAQPMYLVDTGASASIIACDMLTDTEKCSMQDPADMPMQVIAVNSNNIKVYGKVTHTVQLSNKLHCHAFIITALPRPLLGWDFLKAQHACLEAAPEVIHFLCPHLFVTLDQ